MLRRSCKKLTVSEPVSESVSQSVSWFNEADPQDDQPKNRTKSTTEIFEVLIKDIIHINTFFKSLLGLLRQGKLFLKEVPPANF